MDTAEAIAHLDNVAERFLKFKQGEGKRPTDEEMRDALQKLRVSRAAAATTKKAKKKSTPLSAEAEGNLLDSMFKPMGAPDDSAS